MKFLKYSILFSLTLLLGLSCPIKRELKTYLGMETSTLLENTLKPNNTANCANYFSTEKIEQQSNASFIKLPSSFHTTTCSYRTVESSYQPIINRDEVARHIPIYILHEQYRL